MTLREEIQNMLASSHYKGNREYEMRSDELANEIMSKIEKILDSINTVGMAPDLCSDPRLYKRGFYDGISYVKQVLA